MSYQPPGDYDPRQYQPYNQPPQQPPQPNDPYSQGYNSAPPPPPSYQQEPVQYMQQLPPNMTPPVGVQPGYPPGAPSAMPPQIPPPQQGSNLGLILGVVVGLVVILGVAAVLVVPGMLEDDEEPNQAGSETTSAPAEEESTAEETEGGEEEDGGSTEGSGDWSAWVDSEDDYDANTPEGAAISWRIAADYGDAEAMEELMCSDPGSDLEWEYDYYTSTEPLDADYHYYAATREKDGQLQVVAEWSITGDEPDPEDLYVGFVAVEEGGQWKLCDYIYF